MGIGQWHPEPVSDTPERLSCCLTAFVFTGIVGLVVGLLLVAAFMAGWHIPIISDHLTYNYIVRPRPIITPSS